MRDGESPRNLRLLRRLRSSPFVELAILTAMFLCGSSAQGASILNFPRLSFEPNTLTGVALVNPSGEPAEVTITAFGEDGQVLTGIINPAQVTVAAGQQYSKLTSELFGEGLDPSTVGWFQATSDTDGLTGFFLFLNLPPFVIFDGADLPSSAKAIVFSQIRADPGYQTELNIINPGTVPAELDLQLIPKDSSPTEKALSLAGKGAVRLDVASFFQVPEIVSDAYVKVTSNVQVAGFQLVSGLEGDLVGLNARSAEERLTHLYFPQMAVLGGFETTVGIVNNSTQDLTLTLSVFQPDGSLYGAEHLGNNPVTQSLNANAIEIQDLESLFGFAGEKTLDGWLQVESTSEAVTGFLTYRLPGMGAAATVTPTAEGQTQAIFSHIATVDGMFTGVAALNPGQQVANVQILAIQPSGEILGASGTILPPGERISMLITELIPAAVDQPGGLIFVRSDVPVYLTSLFGTNNSTILSNIPAQPSPPNYAPDAELEPLRVTPKLAAVEPNQSQKFEVHGAEDMPVWKVNGVIGGDATVGTIDEQGNYTAPTVTPQPPLLIVSAEIDSQKAAASVDVLEKESRLTTASTIQSLVYLASQERLYTVEGTLTGASGDLELGSVSPSQESGSSDVFEVSADGQRTFLASFEGTISEMVAYQASGGQEMLVLASRTGGQVVRLDPETAFSEEIANGLNEPGSLVMDPVSGDLLVVERTQVTRIARGVLEAGLNQAMPPDPTETTRFSQFFPIDAGDGIAVDRCTGDIYLSKRGNGEIVRYERSSEEFQSIVAGLLSPSRLLALYRVGGSCPDSFHLFVLEQEADRILLVFPDKGSALPWIQAQGAAALSFLPLQNSFAFGQAVLLAEEDPEGTGSSSISLVHTPDLYRAGPVNPPRIDEPREGQVDLTIHKNGSANRVAPGDRLTYTLNVTNRGPAQASSVRVTDELPSHVTLVSILSSHGSCTESGPVVSCDLGDLEKGAEASVTLDVDVGVPSIPILINSAYVESEEEEFDDSDNLTEEMTLVDLPLAITSSSPLPNGTMGEPYSLTLVAVGGNPPYVWSLVSGSLPSGLVLRAGGSIDGTAVEIGVFDFTLAVTDSEVDSAERAFSLTIEPPPLTITTGSPPPTGVVNRGYLWMLTASGGTPPYTWSLSAGLLPEGLILNEATGLVSGNPTQEGVSQFTAGVTDDSGTFVEEEFDLMISPELTITSSPILPDGEVGVSYSATLTANGGTPPYEWSLVDGSLPEGLFLDNGGLVSGIPTQEGSFLFTARVTEEIGDSTEQQFSLAIHTPLPPPLIITTGSNLPSGELGNAYSVMLEATGGVPPYTWSLVSGALPGGLMLNSGGLISGTPTGEGAFQFSARVADNTGTFVEGEFDLTISPEPTELAITTPSPLPDGALGIFYVTVVEASGGVPPYSWTLKTGTLPSGIEIIDLGITTFLTGAPTQTGSFNFTLEVTDSESRAAEKSFALTIGPAPQLEIITDPPLSDGQVGIPYSDVVEIQGGTPPYEWSLSSGSLPPGIMIQVIFNFLLIDGVPTQTGTFPFTLQVQDSASATASKAFTITIAESAPFTITTDLPLPDGTLNEAYSETLTATGGTPLYTWSLLDGDLPGGLMLEPQGLISGTPTAVGTFTFTIQVEDIFSLTTQKAFMLTIN